MELFRENEGKREQMLENLQTVSEQVLILFVLIGVGYLCGKIKLLKEESIKGITELVLYVVMPMAILESFVREFDVVLLEGLIITFCAALLTHLMNIFLAKLFVHDKELRRQKVLRFSVIFSNAGFMALPLQSVLLGSTGVFYGAAYVCAFNFFVWSYGVILMGGGKKSVSIQKVLLNPGIISVIVGAVLFFTSFSLPNVLTKPIGYLAALNTPLPMITIGFYLSQAKLKETLKVKGFYVASFLRLVVSPLLLLGGLLLLVKQETVVVACVIAASAPVAAVSTMFSAKFNQDTQLSVGLVSLTTLLSIITMPLLVGLTQSLF